MLSILIPVYNYDAFLLVKEIHSQVVKTTTIFEILVFDDASEQYLEENKAIHKLSYCTYIQLPENIGRSAIRNLLASKATYDFLLFIDAGTFPLKKNFIKTYLENIDQKVVTGGMTYKKERPEKPYTLRWLYTKERESLPEKQQRNRPIICSSNFLIQKEVFNTITFDESLKKYGCEDVIFFDMVVKEGILIKHIDNPVIHDANDDANTFIKKTENAIDNMITLIDTNKMSKNRFKVSSIYYIIHHVRIDKLILFIFKRFKNTLTQNFNSSKPSILYYDFYRLGYFCFVKNKK